MAKKTKRKLNILLAYLLIVVMLAASLPMGLAWYSDNTRSNAGMTGTVQGNYFEGGDGSQSDPFIIARPIQLYYFAWLQNLGNFNTLDEEGNVKQVYFKIEVADDDGVGNNTLDMTGIELPPIGTVEHPFIGSFDGNGAIITNLTVLADMNDSQGGYYHPPTIVSEDFGVQIIGFFGVVGSTNGNTVTIEGADYTYDSSAVSVRNVILNNVTIDSVRPLDSQTLVGVVAGYVNGSVTNVAVGKATIAVQNGVSALNVGTSNYSDYSLIGYCTEQFKDSLSVFDVKIAAPSIKAVDPSMGDDSNADSNWGGSIDMFNMYDNLNNIYNAATSPTYVTNEHITEDWTNLDASGKPTVSIDNSTSSTETNFRLYDSGSGGNFVFSYYRDTNYKFLYGKNNEDNGEYIAGTKTVTKDIIKEEDVTLIKDDDFYLGVKNGSIFTVTQSERAASWNISNTTGGFYLSTTVGGAVYYLNRSGTTQLTVSTSTNNRTVWNQENTAFYCTVDGVRYYIDCYNGNWQLSTTGTTSYSYFLISYNGNYLNLVHNGDGVAELAVGNSESTATRWQFSDAATPGGLLSTTIDSITYYLNPEVDPPALFGNATYSFTITQEQGNQWQNNNGSLSYSVRGGLFNTTYTGYLNYGNNTWRFTNNSQTLTITEQIETIDFTTIDRFATIEELQDALRIETVTTTEDSKIDLPDTWFPLAMEQDEQGNYIVSDKNTGYVVSGSDYKENGSFPQMSGDIRVSRYNRSNINNSLNGSALNHARVYSISYLNCQDNRFSYIGSKEAAQSSFGFERYSSSADKMNETLARDTNVYGLHFMDAAIDIKNYATISEAKLNLGGNQPEIIANYQVPRNAITFNLAKAGYINFFAGTYYTYSGQNKNFFSLYDIERNGGTLTAIREIKYVYGVVDSNNKIVKSYPYIYEYAVKAQADVQYSGEFEALPEGYQYTKVFDTSWLTSPVGFQNNYVYYFEIPVNEGEYALGSVAGADGAYLIYLDLAANAQQVQEITTTEYVMSTKSTYEYPLGVQLVDVDGYSLDGFDQLDSAAIRIESVGAITVERDGDNIVVSTPQGESPPTFTPTFVGDGLTMTNGPNELTPRPLYQITVLERRETVRTINMITLEEVVTVTTTTQTTVSMENEGQEVVVSVTVTQTIRTIRIDKAGVASEPEVQQVANAEQFELPEGVQIIVTAHGITSNTDATVGVGATTVQYEVEEGEPDENGNYNISIDGYEITLNISDAELEQDLGVTVDQNASYDVTVDVVADNGQAA